MGRPLKYTPEVVSKIGDYIVEEMAKGRSLSSIVEHDEGMPVFKTIFDWLRDNDDFIAKYTRARELQAHRMAEEIFSIADDSSGDQVTRYKEDGTEYKAIDHDNINRARLRVDTRKWYLSKVLPKLYGDKIEVNQTSEVTHHHIVSLPRPESREEWLKAIETTTVKVIEHDDSEQS